MKPSVPLLALAAASLLLSAPASAATYQVDDSATIPFESAAALKWRQVAPSRGGDNTLEGSAKVQVRLNVAPWQSRSGRIFLVLPEQPVGQVVVNWTTQGRLLPGRLVSGSRALVYSGPIAAPMIDETLVLQIEADGTRLGGAQRLNFHFEIDVD